MDEDLLKENQNLNKKFTLKKFYEANKILVYSIVLISIIFISSLSFYLEIDKRKKINLAENYMKAKIYLKNNNKNKAKNILETIVFENNSTYSTLSLFLILRENLIDDQNELSHLFDHILKNNKFEKEIKNLIIFKKALFQSDYVNESELIDIVKPIISSDTLWKPHALLLLGDYFVSKNEYLKAKEFYAQVLTLKNLHMDLYDQAQFKLALITNG